MYCWYQTEPQSVWHLALASERANILRTKFLTADRQLFA